MVLVAVLMSCSNLAMAQEAEHLQWQWSDDYASVFKSMMNNSGDYEITVKKLPHPGTGNELEIGVSHPERGKIFQWPGHRYTVFLIEGDRLYWANFGSSGSGGEIVAVDLSTGKEIWRHRLLAMGEVVHSGYFNQMILVLRDKTVVVYGKESYGHYVEVINAETGQLVGHEVYRAPVLGRTTSGPSTLPATAPATQPATPDEAALRKIAMDYLAEHYPGMADHTKLHGELSDEGEQWLYGFQSTEATQHTRGGGMPLIYIDKATLKVDRVVFTR